MICTEEEAKTKWCPFANVYVRYQNTGAAGNRGLDAGRDMQASEHKARCIGSACMAWHKTDNIAVPATHDPNSSAVYNFVYKAAGRCGLTHTGA